MCPQSLEGGRHWEESRHATHQDVHEGVSRFYSAGLVPHHKVCTFLLYISSAYQLKVKRMYVWLFSHAQEKRNLYMMARMDVLVLDMVSTASYLIQTGLLSLPGTWVTPHETCLYVVYVSTINSDWHWMEFFPYDSIYNRHVYWPMLPEHPLTSWFAATLVCFVKVKTVLHYPSGLTVLLMCVPVPICPRQRGERWRRTTPR